MSDKKLSQFKARWRKLHFASSLSISSLSKLVFIDGSKAVFRNLSFYTWLFVVMIAAIMVAAHQEDRNLWQTLSWYGLSHFGVLISNYWSSGALTLPVFMGLYLAIHRSHALELKNNFDRRFKHEEEFENHLMRFNKEPDNQKGFTIEFAKPFRAYSLFFPENVTSAEYISVSSQTLDFMYGLLAEKEYQFYFNCTLQLENATVEYEGLEVDESEQLLSLIMDVRQFFGMEVRLDGAVAGSDDELLTSNSRSWHVDRVKSIVLGGLDHAARFMQHDLNFVREIKDRYRQDAKEIRNNYVIERQKFFKRKNNLVHKL